MIIERLRSALGFLRRTPLHPQWLTLRDERNTRRWVASQAAGRVLDIGCASKWASEVVGGSHYIGLDYPVTVEAFYDSRPDVFADGAALPFGSASMDTVLLLEVLEHVSDAGRVLQEAARVLKPQGKLLLTVPFLYPLHNAPHDYRRYTAPGLSAAIAQAGLECEPVIPRTQGFEAVALLAAIACAESVLSAIYHRRWTLIFAPLLIAAIPFVNIGGWLFARLCNDSKLLATNYQLLARKVS